MVTISSGIAAISRWTLCMPLTTWQTPSGSQTRWYSKPSGALVSLIGLVIRFLQRVQQSPGQRNLLSTPNNCSCSRPWEVWPKTRPSRKAPIPDQGMSARPRPIPTFGRTLPSWLSRYRKIHREAGHKKPPCIRTGGLRCRSALLFGGFSTMGWGASIGIPPDGDHPSD